MVENMVFKAIGFAALCPSTNQIQALAEKRIKASLEARLLINGILNIIRNNSALKVQFH